MLVPSFFDKLKLQPRHIVCRGCSFSVSKKSPKGGFFGKMEKGDKRCTREKEMDDEK